jgi:hypothetical protein
MLGHFRARATVGYSRKFGSGRPPVRPVAGSSTVTSTACPRPLSRDAFVVPTCPLGIKS